MKRPSVLLILATVAATVGLVESRQQIHTFPGAIEGYGGMRLIDTSTNADLPNYIANSSHTAATGYLGSLYYQLGGVSVARIAGREFVADEYGLAFFTFNINGMTPKCTLTGDGEFQCATQPGFLAYNSAEDANQAANSVMDFDTEVKDAANNFTNDTFTAPVTGTYLLCTFVMLTNQSVTTASPANLRIDTSNAPYYVGWVDAIPGAGTVGLGDCVHADMDAADTAQVKLFSNTQNMRVLGSGTRLTYFSGQLQF